MRTMKREEIISLILIGLAILFFIFVEPIQASSGYPVAGITRALSEMTTEAIAKADVEEAEVEVVAEYEFVDDTNPLVTEQDIELLARLITAEVGYSEAYTTEEYEEICYLTGAVVLNRINDPDFSNNLYGVIYQQGQYACTWDGNMERPYDDIAWEIAEGLLTYGVENVPTNLVWQAGFPQGTTYKVIRGMYFGTKE